MDVSFGLDPIGWILGGIQTINDINRQNYEKEADERNFEYQKELQQQIFAREDNALQRRMQDAEKAGLNPFSVANGSGAGAGAVVSKNSTPSLPSIGGLLDQYSAIRRLPLEMKNLEEGARKAAAEADIAEANASMAEFASSLTKANNLIALGFDPDVSLRMDEHGNINSVFTYYSSDPKSIKDTQYYKNLQSGWDFSLAKSDIAQYERNTYALDESYGMIMPLLRLLLDAAGLQQGRRN